MSGNMRRIAVASVFTFALLLSVAGGSPSAGAQAAGQNPPSRPGNQPAPTARPQAQNGAQNPFMPAKAVSAADVQYPFQTAADAIVVFDVSVGARGEAGKITVLQDVPPFTAAAEQSLHNWKFAAAAQNSRPEDSHMLVAFVFRHAVYIANPPTFSPIFPAKESNGASGDFVAPAILYAVYAAYPAKTIAQGSVVVQANVNADGSTGEVNVLRDLGGGFEPLAVDATKQWRFQSALRAGQNVPSKVAIAFVFSSRALNPF